MAPLTKNNSRGEMDGKTFADPVAADTQIFAGSLVALDAAGNAIPATAAATNVRGVCVAGVDNRDGVAGAKDVTSRKGLFRFAGTGLDRTDIGTDVSVVDDNTVGGAGAAIAGELMQIDATGHWVKVA